MHITSGHCFCFTCTSGLTVGSAGRGPGARPARPSVPTLLFPCQRIYETRALNHQKRRLRGPRFLRALRCGRLAGGRAGRAPGRPRQLGAGAAQRVQPFACTTSSGSSDVAVGRSYSLTSSLLSLDTRLTPEAINMVRKQHIQSPWDWVRYRIRVLPFPSRERAVHRGLGGQSGSRRPSPCAWWRRAPVGAVAAAPPRGAAQLSAAGLASGGASGNSTAPGRSCRRSARRCHRAAEAATAGAGLAVRVTAPGAPGRPCACAVPAFSERFALASLPPG